MSGGARWAHPRGPGRYAGVTFSVNVDEKALIQKAAIERRMQVSTFVRELVLAAIAESESESEVKE